MITVGRLQLPVNTVHAAGVVVQGEPGRGLVVFVGAGDPGGCSLHVSARDRAVNIRHTRKPGATWYWLLQPPEDVGHKAVSLISLGTDLWVLAASLADMITAGCHYRAGDPAYAARWADTARNAGRHIPRNGFLGFDVQPAAGNFRAAIFESLAEDRT